jgi:hypothetical protein
LGKKLIQNRAAVKATTNQTRRKVGARMSVSFQQIEVSNGAFNCIAKLEAMQYMITKTFK